MNESSKTFAVVSERVVLPDGVTSAAVVVAGEKIAEVSEPASLAPDIEVADVGDLVVSPGVVDSHVHINEPGRADWEGFATATQAAAAGGITTLIDMPLNSHPVTTTVEAYHLKQKAAEKQVYVDVGFYGGLVPGNEGKIQSLIDAGVCGVKCFLCNSGLDEFPPATEKELRAALPVLAQHEVPLLVHAELIDKPQPAKIGSYAEWLAARPARFEDEAIRILQALCEYSRAPIHVVHVSSGDSIAILQEARSKGLPMTAETCPHYLHFSAEGLDAGSTLFKCAPPIRFESDRQALWSALENGVLISIGSDHSPCPPYMKRIDESDFAGAWGGIASLELMLPTVWKGAAERDISLYKMSEWLSMAPARLAGLDHRKGRIQAGYDADMVIWDPDVRWQVEPAKLHQKHKITPYASQELRGRVKQTYLRGNIVYDNGSFTNDPQGAVLRRQDGTL